MFQIASYRLNYFKSFTNYIESVTYIISILYVVDVSDMGKNTGVREVNSYLLLFHIDMFVSDWNPRNTLVFFFFFVFMVKKLCH